MQFVRACAAQVLWWACAACALVLVLGVLLVALTADTSLAWVSALREAADVVGFGVFSPGGGAMSFAGEYGRVHAALANGAAGALAYLLVGWLAQRLVRPS